MGLSEEQVGLLRRLGLPTDFSDLTDDEWFAISDAMSEEMAMRGIDDAGEGLNDYGALCRSVICALPDD